jgi:hypothetical protein
MSRDICVFTRLLGGAIDADASFEALDGKVGVQLLREHQSVAEHTSAGRRYFPVPAASSNLAFDLCVNMAVSHSRQAGEDIAASYDAGPAIVGAANEPSTTRAPDHASVFTRWTVLTPFGVTSSTANRGSRA